MAWLGTLCNIATRWIVRQLRQIQKPSSNYVRFAVSIFLMVIN